MCIFKKPKIKTQPVEVSAAQLVPETKAPAPEAPSVGGTNDNYNKRKGRKQLTIERDSYNPVNY